MTSNTPLGGLLGTKLTETVAGTGTSLDQGNQIKLGTEIPLNESGVAVYVHAAAAIAKNLWVGIDENMEASLLTHAIAADGHLIGCATYVSLADNDFGWVAVRGVFDGHLIDASAEDVALYTSATAGKLTSTSVTSSVKIDGVVATVSAPTADPIVEVIASYMRPTSF
jgi:hypothetical protein